MTPQHKALAVVGILAAAVFYAKRSSAATVAGDPLGPLGASTASGQGFGGGGTLQPNAVSAGSGSSGLGALLQSMITAITPAPAPDFAPAPAMGTTAVSAPSVAMLASVAPAPAAPESYYSAPVTSSEGFWAKATAPEPLPGVWGYQAPGVAPAPPPAYGTPAAAPSVSYSEAGTSGYTPANAAPSYGSNLELASREWIDYQANTGGAGSGV